MSAHIRSARLAETEQAGGGFATASSGPGEYCILHGFTPELLNLVTAFIIYR